MGADALLARRSAREKVVFTATSFCATCFDAASVRALYDEDAGSDGDARGGSSMSGSAAPPSSA